ncbi:MAG: adenosylcobinamide-phosphate synthase CbiB [Pseudomonadota bacterium]
MSLAAALLIALLLDARLGEPGWLWQRLPHPAVLMGRAVGALDAALNRGEHKQVRGLIALAILLGGALGTGLLIAALPLQPLPQVIGGAILLAQRSLVDHVRAVADGLDRGIDGARHEVAKIVGRDTATLDGPGIARAAIESGSENFSDGVVAPAFWFALFGLPGMLVYKAANTADSMIGYRTPRHAEFGRAAARFDDLVNVIPARLSALLLALSTFSPHPWRIAMRDAHLHRSPNAGWPEAAMAAAIGTALAGPRIYDGQRTDDPFVYAEGTRTPGADHIRRACQQLWRGWAVLFALTGALALLT